MLIIRLIQLFEKAHTRREKREKNKWRWTPACHQTMQQQGTISKICDFIIPSAIRGR